VPVSDGVTIGSLGVSFRAGRGSPLQQAGPSLITTAERVTRALSLTI
jgi:hypothetical protein